VSLYIKKNQKDWNKIRNIALSRQVLTSFILIDVIIEHGRDHIAVN